MSFSEDFLYTDCPWCFTKNVALIRHGRTIDVADTKHRERQWTLTTCPRCAGAILMETHPLSLSLVQTVPLPTNGQNQVKHLPNDVESYYSNAQIALNAGIPSSAAVELRRTLEAAAKHQGVEERTLVQAVKKLVEQGLVTKSFESVLSHVRKIGNQGAHAGDEQLTTEEVEAAMEFTTQFLKNLFEVPEELRLLQETDTTKGPEE